MEYINPNNPVGGIKRPPSAQERYIQYMNELSKRYTPTQQNRDKHAMNRADMSSQVGAGIEQILKGAFAGGQGSGDVGHWQQAADRKRQRLQDRRKSSDKRLDVLGQLAKTEETRADKDPVSDKSRRLQHFMASRFPEFADRFKEMSGEEMRGVVPLLNKKGESEVDRRLKEARINKIEAEIPHVGKSSGNRDILDALRMQIMGQQLAKAKASAPGGELYDLDVAGKDLSRQSTQARLDKMEREASEKPSRGESLDVSQKKVVETLSSQNAKKIAISNQLQGFQEQMSSTENEDDKIRIGRQMLKVINSTEGADAIGVDEARRLSDELEFKMFNLLEPGPMFGRDVPAFERRLDRTIKSVNRAVELNEQQIDKIMGGPAEGAQGKSVVDKKYSPSRNQTRIFFSDGSWEDRDGQQ